MTVPLSQVKGLKREALVLLTLTIALKISIYSCNCNIKFTTKKITEILVSLYPFPTKIETKLTLVYYHERKMTDFSSPWVLQYTSGPDIPNYLPALTKICNWNPGCYSSSLTASLTKLIQSYVSCFRGNYCQTFNYLPNINLTRALSMLIC